MREHRVSGLRRNGNKGILYYTDNRINKRLSDIVRKYILDSELPIISVSLKPIEFGNNIHYHGRRSHSTMFKQILTGLQAIKYNYVFMCEHDVLYHKSHFDFDPPRSDVYYYNNNVWKYRLKDKKVIGYDCKWLSQCCASRNILIEHYEKKLALMKHLLSEVLSLKYIFLLYRIIFY
jgi:hypothetical protein